MFRTIARLVVAAGLLASVSAAPFSKAEAQTVILVRHAEQDRAIGGRDPPLSAAGQARAEALAQGLAGAKVTTVLTSQLKRTIDTAAPTAARAGVTGRVIPTGPDHIAQTVAAVRAAGPGGVVLIAGHSNTVPALVKALGGKAGPDLDETIYDTMVTLRLDGPQVIEIDSRYGSPLPGPPPPKPMS